MLQSNKHHNTNKKPQVIEIGLSKNEVSLVEERKTNFRDDIIVMQQLSETGLE